MHIYSTVSTSNKISNLFTDNIAETYPKFIEFVESYYQSQESTFGNLDILNNLLSYYNIRNEKINKLKESTVLITDSNNSISVRSTNGFPDSGFIKIDNEYIYYKSKNKNIFIDCTRGVSASSVIDDKFVYSSSIYIVHSVKSVVYNVAHTFSNYLLNQFKYIYLQNLPAKLNPKINYGILISNIKDFYASKGSVDSIKFLFKILYDDSVVKLRLKPKGSGAVVGVSAFAGKIDTVVVINGGSGYNNDPKYYPQIELIGIGTGAKLKINSIINGIITAVSIVDGGELYNNNNNVFITEQDFSNNELITGDNSGANGFVDYWNPDTLELYLSDITDNFYKNELIHTNNAYGLIDKIEVILPEVDILLPYERTLKTSKSNDTFSKVILELDDTINKFNTLTDKSNLTLIQKFPISSSITDLALSISEFNTIFLEDNKRTVVAVVEKTDKLYLPPYTKVISYDDRRILVDSTVRFSSIGVVKIGTEYISYTSKSINEFIGITRNINGGIGHIIVTGDKVAAYGTYDNGNFYNFNLKINDCQFKLIGVASQPKIIDGASGYRTSTITSLVGIIPTDLTQYTWDNTNRVYTSERYTYVASNGVPISSPNSRTYANQKLLKRFFLNDIVESSFTNKSIGLLNSGVEIISYKGETINYGKITKISIADFGKRYYLPNKVNDVYPYLTINDVVYNGLIKIYGNIENVTLDNIPKSSLENYNKKPEILITRGIGDTTGIGLELECDYDVSGRLNGIVVINGGKWYTAIPTITVINGGKYTTPLIIPKENINISGFIGRSNFTNNQLTNLNFDPQLYTDITIPNNLVYDGTPVVTIPRGIGATFSVDTALGVITSVTVNNSGQNYFTVPTLKVINSGGTGAEFIVNTLSGRVVSVEIENGGQGYISNPTLIVDNVTSTAKFECTIEKWTKNVVYDNQQIDSTGGYVYNVRDANFSLENIIDYGHYPQYLQLKYNNTNNTTHSSIIGWAYDSCPIYGSYGYSNPIDSSSQIVDLTTNWQLNTGVLFNRPDGIPGTYVEDYIHISTHLDTHNGRFCITPEFPLGRYCYFASNNFPYFVGDTYKYKFDDYNHQKLKSNSLIPQDSIRVFKNQSNYIFPKNGRIDYIAKISNLATGSITGYKIEFSGTNYQIGDIVAFGNGSAVVMGINNTGGIVSIEIIDAGFNLTTIPPYTINSKNGFGALLVLTSTSIGRIKNIEQISNGSDFTGDPTIAYKLKTDLILDIKYNNTIVGFKVLNGGINFNSKPTLVNVDFAYKFNVINGSIIQGTVIDGGKYYETVPTLNFSNGTGATVIPILNKSIISDNSILYYGISRNQYVGSAKINYYDINASTTQIKVLTGNFDTISDLFYLWDDVGNKVGKIDNIRAANITCSSGSCSYVITQKNNDSIINYDNLLTDNQKYQQFSYTIASNHSIETWKPIVVDNTHMLGNKLTSIYKLENIIKFYTHRQKQIFNLVDYRVDVETIIKLLIDNVELLKVLITIESYPEDLTKNTQFSKHYFDYMYFDENYVYSTYQVFNSYDVGDLVWVSEQHDKIILEVINPKKVLATDYSIVKFDDLVYGSNKNSLLEYNGVVQHPKHNYRVTNNLVKIYSAIYNNDRLSLFNFYNAKLIFTDLAYLQNSIFTDLKVNSNIYNPVDPNKLIIFVNNVVTNNYTLANNKVTFDEIIIGGVYGIYSNNIDRLNLVGLTSKIYSITNFTVSNQSLLVFVNGVIQHPDNYSISNNKLIINSDTDVQYVYAWLVDTYVNVDSSYKIIKGVAPKIVPAIFEYNFVDGVLVDMAIKYPGQNYPRYLRLELIGGDNNAVVSLETINGNVTKFFIVNGGSGYTITPTDKIYGFGNIQSQTYPIILDRTDISSLVPIVYIPIVYIPIELTITATQYPIFAVISINTTQENTNIIKIIGNLNTTLLAINNIYLSFKTETTFYINLLN